jgi:hypothetical protein
MPRCTVNGSAEVIVVTALHYTNVHSAAHPKSDSWRRGSVCERLLQPQSGANPIEGIVKRSTHTVTHHLHDGSTIGFDVFTMVPRLDSTATRSTSS